MMATTLRTLFIFSITSLWETVKAYYCDNDRCLENEYCCGENICCDSYKVWELWYFWCGLIFFMFLLSLCACFWRQRSRAYWVTFRTPAPYSPLSTESEPKYSPSPPDLQFHTDPDRNPDGGGSYFLPAQSSGFEIYASHQGHMGSPPPPYTETAPSYDTDRGSKNH